MGNSDCGQRAMADLVFEALLQGGLQNARPAPRSRRAVWI
jgi:hypothetical protein